MAHAAAAPIPLVPVRSAWLEANSARIRSRPIPWEGYQRADLVSAAELRLIKKVDNPSAVDTDASEYALLYLRLLTKLSRTDTLQQILVLIDDLVAGRDDRTELFFAAAAANPESVPSDAPLPAALPWGPFLKQLDAQDEFVQIKAAQFLLLLLVSGNQGSKAPVGVFSRLVDYLSTLIQSAAEETGAPAYLTGTGYADGNALDLGTQLLNALLRNAQLRQQFWSETRNKEEGTHVPILSKLLDILSTTIKANSSSGAASLAAGSSSGGRGTNQGALVSQYQYQIILNFWLLSFDPHIASELTSESLPVATVLAEVGAATNKEKVIRIIMATFSNLLHKAPEPNSHALLGAKVLPLVENLSGRKWSDEDLVADLKVLQSELSEKLKNMTTLDVYLAELDSGRLTWDNPLHESDEFWAAATPQLLDDKAAGLHKLLDLITSSSDATTLAVASNDLGKVVVQSETAKRLVNKSSAKVRMMELMSYDNKDVKFYALHSVGKLVSAAWR